MDKKLINRRFSDAVASYDSEAVVQREVAHRLAQMIEQCGVKSDATVLEIGCGTGMLSREIFNKFTPEKLTLNDLSSAMESKLQDILGDTVSFVAGDAEKFEWEAEAYDLIATSSTVQWFADPERFIENCYGSLRQGGVLAIATYGKENFKELQQVGQPTLEYTDLVPFVSQKFAQYTHLDEIIEKQFTSPLHVLQHLKRTGANAIKAEGWSKGKLEQFCADYNANSSDNNGVTLSYNPVYIIAKKR